MDYVAGRRQRLAETGRQNSKICSKKQSATGMMIIPRASHVRCRTFFASLSALALAFLSAALVEPAAGALAFSALAASLASFAFFAASLASCGAHEGKPFICHIHMPPPAAAARCTVYIVAAVSRTARINAWPCYSQI